MERRRQHNIPQGELLRQQHFQQLHQHQQLLLPLAAAEHAVSQCVYYSSFFIQCAKLSQVMAARDCVRLLDSPMSPQAAAIQSLVTPETTDDVLNDISQAIVSDLTTDMYCRAKGCILALVNAAGEGKHIPTQYCSCCLRPINRPSSTAFRHFLFLAGTCLCTLPPSGPPMVTDGGDQWFRCEFQERENRGPCTPGPGVQGLERVKRGTLHKQ